MMEEITVKEMCEVMSHIERKVKSLSNFLNPEMENRVYVDVYRQAVREAGAYSLDSIKQKYLYAVHEAIDCYTLPAYMRGGN